MSLLGQRLSGAGVSFDDWRSMQISNHGRFGFVTEQLWAMDDVKVRKVVLVKLWRQASSRKLIQLPDANNLAAVREIEKRAMRRLSRHPILSRHSDKVEQHGGLLAYWTSLIYRRYRMKDDMSALAEHYGMDGNTIRQQLFRLNEIARQLYPADVASFPKKGAWNSDPSSPGAKRRAARKQRVKERAERLEQINALAAQGLSSAAIARQLNMRAGYVRCIRYRHKKENTSVN
jgi:DNA-binding NarL/FixJ family response regulator